MTAPESPRADVGLTEAEREALLPVLWTETGRAQMIAAVERILADRLAAVQAERNEMARQFRVIAALHRSAEADVREAQAERDDLRARLLAVEGGGLEPLLRKAARDFRGLEESDYWDSGISTAQAAALRAVLASPSAREWPDCATYPNLGCVCRGGLQPSKGTCTRKRTGDLTPLASPSTHTQRDTETAAQALREAADEVIQQPSPELSTSKSKAWRAGEMHARHLAAFILRARADSLATAEGS